jgi:FAD/FMN-containing dehydrogenase
MAEHWPKVMRRVGGYNLDIFDNQSEKPYTADGSVNLAHLLVGSEGTLAYTRSLKLKLAPLPRAKVLGIVNFPTFHAGDGFGAAHRQAGAHGGGAGRPHHDRAARWPTRPSSPRSKPR